MSLVRRACLFVFAFLILQQAAFAQETPKAGAMIGVNESWFATTPKNDISKKPGVMFGAFAVLMRDSFIKIQPEIQFSQRNTDAKFGGSTSGFSTTYLNLSLMTRLKLFKGWYTSQGVQFSTPMRSKLDLGGATKVDIKDNIRSDISIPAGVGRQFGRLGIEGRYDAGLKQVEKGPLGNFIKRNRAITIFAIIGL